jgi:DNA-binding CsgD family transcriptional regulator/PAS domain-containing protein
MIPETEILLDLIGTIYDTTLDRALWPEVLRRSAEFVGGSASSLYSKNTARKTGNKFLCWSPRFDAAALPSYFDEYVRIDPATTCQFLFDVGQIYSMGDCMPYAEFMETRVYKEWARPLGLADQLAATLDKSAMNFSLFAVFRSEEQGRADDEMRRRMGLVVPHIRRAVLIGNVMDLNVTEKTAFADALDGLAAGVFLVDEGARIVFANRSGQGMLDDGKILCQKNRVLTAVDRRTGTTLPDVIASARDGDAAIGANGIAVPLSSHSAEPWLAHILPLTSGARRQAGIAHSAVAAVFVHQASLDAPSAMETMSKLYGLTPGELRVLAAVSVVGGVAAVAEVVGIAESTVRTHLLRLFAKTGTNRQSDLVKLVATHASPLRQVSEATTDR